jgi:hypothetical protein
MIFEGGSIDALLQRDGWLRPARRGPGAPGDEERPRPQDDDKQLRLPFCGAVAVTLRAAARARRMRHEAAERDRHDKRGGQHQAKPMSKPVSQVEF